MDLSDCYTAAEDAGDDENTILFDTCMDQMVDFLVCQTEDPDLETGMCYLDMWCYECIESQYYYTACIMGYEDNDCTDEFESMMTCMMANDCDMDTDTTTYTTTTDGDDVIAFENGACIEGDTLFGGAYMMTSCTNGEVTYSEGESCDDMISIFDLTADGETCDAIMNLVAYCTEDAVVVWPCDADVDQCTMECAAPASVESDTCYNLCMTCWDDTACTDKGYSTVQECFDEMCPEENLSTMAPGTVEAVSFEMTFTGTCDDVAADQDAIVSVLANQFGVDDEDVEMGTCVESSSSRRLLSTSVAVPVTVTTDDPSLADSIVEQVNDADFVSEMNSDLADAGVSVTADSVTEAVSDVVVVTVFTTTTEGPTDTMSTTDTADKSDDDDDDDDDEGSATGAIVGGVVGALVLLILFGWCMYVKTHPKEGLFPCCGGKKSGGSGNVQMA